MSKTLMQPTDRAIPRDLPCWYCVKGQHTRCALLDTCACWTCYPRHPAPKPMEISPCPLVVNALMAGAQ